jgi:antitoxin component of MazEF toxin-antitoxin module
MEESYPPSSDGDLVNLIYLGAVSIMPVFTSSRKVLVSGTSLAMTLPAMFVKVSEIKKGSKLEVMYGLDGVLIISQSENLHVKEGLSKILKKLEENELSTGLVDEGF